MADAVDANRSSCCPSRTPQLLAYRKGAYDPAPALEKLEPGVRAAILHMIQRDPAARKSATGYLQVRAATCAQACGRLSSLLLS